MPEARTAYEAAVTADPDEPCGGSGLQALARAHLAETCPTAAALHHAGDDTDAKAILSNALESNPVIPCAERLLKSIDQASLTDRLRSFLQNALWWALLLAVVAFVVLLALRLVPKLGMPIRRKLNGLLPPQLVINDLGDYGGEPKAAPSVGALVAARFAPTAAEAKKLRRKKHYRTKSDVAPIGQVDLRAELGNAYDTVSRISPQIAQLAAVAQAMQMLLGVPRRFSVAGQIHSSPTDGTGITLRLWDQGLLRSATTIWRRDPDPQHDVTIDDFHHLVVPAAAWLQHELADALGRGEKANSTTSTSYAYLAAGIYAQRQDHDEARRWFKRALSNDPKHLRARIALALAYDSSMKPEEIEQNLKDTLAAVQTELRQPRLDLGRKDRVNEQEAIALQCDRFRLIFSLLALKLNKIESVDGPKRKETLDAIAKQAKKAVIDGDGVQKKMDRYKGSAVVRATDFLAKAMLPSLKVLRAGALLEVAHIECPETTDPAGSTAGSWSASRNEIESIVKGVCSGGDGVTYRVDYNLACFWSRVATTRLSIDGGIDPIADLNSDPGADENPGGLLSRIASHYAKAPAAAAAPTTPPLQKSFAHLARSLATAPPREASRIAQLAKTDPALETLKRDHEPSGSVDLLLDKYVDMAPPDDRQPETEEPALYYAS